MSAIDIWTTTSDGIKYQVRLLPDYDTTPDDFECYTPKQVAAWKRDEWGFIGVEVSAMLDGLDPAGFSASLWGIDYGYLPITDQDDNLIGESYDSDEYIRADVVPDLIDEIGRAMKQTLLDLRAKISAQLYKMGA